MPPVNSAPSSEVDNEATAELPVLDVAAYESSLKEDEGPAHTDTWVLPGGAFKPAEATAEIPTLTQVVPAYDLDHSGTHEMPSMLLAKPAQHGKATKAPRAAGASNKRAEKAEPVAAAPAMAPAPAALATPLPPSPPMIEELRGALAAAQRRITELDERARIADAERSVAIARANAECAQYIGRFQRG